MPNLTDDEGNDYGPPPGWGGYPEDPTNPNTNTNNNGGGGGGGSSALDFITRLIGGNGGGGILSNPMLIPALTSALSQWKDSDKYIDKSEEWAKDADPFGSQRGFYADKLHSMVDDPNSFLANDPYYQGILRNSLNPAESKMRAKGYGNSGNILSELTRVSSDTASKYMGDTMDRFGKFAGALFGPDTAAQLKMKGLEGSINSKNGALASLFYPFLMTAYNGNGNPNGGNGGNGGTNNGGNGGGGGNNGTGLPFNLLDPRTWGLGGGSGGGGGGNVPLNPTGDMPPPQDFGNDPPINDPFPDPGFGDDPYGGGYYDP